MISGTGNEQELNENLSCLETMQESLRVIALIDYYREMLEKTDVDGAFLDSVSAQSGALSYSISTLRELNEIMQCRRREYDDLRKEGVARIRQLLDFFDYIFSKKPSVKKTIRKIRSRGGELEIMKNLLAVHRIASDNEVLLREAQITGKAVERIGSIHKALSALESRLIEDSTRVAEAVMLCEKYRVRLELSLDMIYEAGQVAFEHHPEIRARFNRNRGRHECDANGSPLRAGSPLQPFTGQVSNRQFESPLTIKESIPEIAHSLSC